MSGAPLSIFAELWKTTGVSEFVSAIVGAAIGSLSAGAISWYLQRASFRKDGADRAREKRDHDRALVLQAFYSCLHAMSDAYKFSEEVKEADTRRAGLPQPKIPGLSNAWQGLNALATLPEAISIDPAAITVFVDQKTPELAMDVLDIVAVQRASLKMWQRFSDVREKFGEKVGVEFDGSKTYTAMSMHEIGQSYPLLRTLSDLANGISESAERDYINAKEVVVKVQDFLSEKLDTHLGLTFPDGTARLVGKNQGATPPRSP